MSDSDSESDTKAAKDPSDGHSTFELLATILLAIAAVATAWAGFESSKWGGVQATSFSQAGAARTESVRSSTLAGQQASVDVTTFFNWLNAVVDDAERGDIVEPESAAAYEPTEGTLSGFTFNRFREEFRPAVRAWLDTNPFGNPSAPSSPFDVDEYVLAASVEAGELEDKADAKATAAAEANQTADNYVVTTVLFATALFFAAMSSKLVAARYKVMTLVLAALVFAGTALYMLTLPIEI